jgi:hypothetical protein
VAAGLAGCGRLDELIYAPPTTAQQWCEQRPCIAVAGTVLDEPLGTTLVFLLAGLWLAAGIRFLVSRRDQSSRSWLGIALVLGGIGAALTDISYQAFGYRTDGGPADSQRCGQAVRERRTGTWSGMVIGARDTTMPMRSATGWITPP